MHSTGRFTALALAAAVPLHALAQDPAACAAPGRREAPRVLRRDLPQACRRARADRDACRPERAQCARCGRHHAQRQGPGRRADYLTKFWELDDDSQARHLRRSNLPAELPAAGALLEQRQQGADQPHAPGRRHVPGNTARPRPSCSCRCAPRSLDDVLLPQRRAYGSRTRSSPSGRCGTARTRRRSAAAITSRKRCTWCRFSDQTGRPRRRLALAPACRQASRTNRTATACRCHAAGTTRTSAPPFTHGDVALRARYNQRLGEEGVDDNPHITDYIGSTELSGVVLSGRVDDAAHRAHVVQGLGSRLAEVRVDAPGLQAAKPDGLRYYVQLFTGYGETMLDYNHFGRTASAWASRCSSCERRRPLLLRYVSPGSQHRADGQSA